MREAAHPRNARVLVAEHEHTLARTLEATLRGGGYDVVGSVESGQAAVERAAVLNPDIVVVDLDLEGVLGAVQAAEAIASVRPVAIVFLASQGSAARVHEAHLAGPLACLIKPLRPAELRSTVELTLRQQEIEARLLTSEARLREMVEHAADAILIADHAGRYIDVNQAACRMLGYERAELVGKRVTDLVAPEEHARLLALKRTVIDTGEPHLGEWTFVRKDGSRFPAETSSKLLRDGRWQVFVRDITLRKDAERQRAVWNAMIAHDLIQPVTAAKVAAEALRGMLKGAGELRALRTITSAMVRLERMAEDLLDVSHIDAHQLQLHLRPVDLVEIARASIERMTTLAGSSPIELSGPDRLPCASADPERIGQVLDNLLSNAIKYGSPGHPIRVELARTGPSAATLSVCNHGPGIAPKDLPFLFQRFHRTPGAWRSGVRGAGLGLHIARALVEAHGGTIEAESVPDRETIFRFTLPC